MTIIAYRDGVMAADSKVNGGDIGIGRFVKITRGPGGWLAGACGNASDCAAFLRWVEAGQKARKRPAIHDDGFAAIVVNRDGHVIRLDDAFQPYLVDAPFHAIGSGAECAIGAMAAGASASRAAEIAAELQAHCGLPVVSLSLK